MSVSNHWGVRNEIFKNGGSYLFSFNPVKRSKTRSTSYIDTAIWKKGVINIQFFYRSEYELDTISLKKALVEAIRDKVGFRRNISILQPLSLYKGKRVYRFEISYNCEERPDDETTLELFNMIKDFPLHNFAEE